MKRFSSFLLCLILVLSLLFSACNSLPQDNTTSVDSAYSSSEPSDSSINTSSEPSAESSSDESLPDQWENPELNPAEIASKGKIDLSIIPDYKGVPYCVIDDDIPDFSKSELRASPFEYYGDLDSLGRCGYAMASLGKETMPAPGEDRESISHIKYAQICLALARSAFLPLPSKSSLVCLK